MTSYLTTSASTNVFYSKPDSTDDFWFSVQTQSCSLCTTASTSSATVLLKCHRIPATNCTPSTAFAFPWEWPWPGRCCRTRRRRRTSTYMFGALRKALVDKFGGIGKVERFLTDYEQAAVNAIHSVFSEVIVKGCSFHFRQAVIVPSQQRRTCGRVQHRRRSGSSWLGASVDGTVTAGSVCCLLLANVDLRTLPVEM